MPLVRINADIKQITITLAVEIFCSSVVILICISIGQASGDISIETTVAKDFNL
jgi:hypothetical protein